MRGRGRCLPDDMAAGRCVPARGVNPGRSGSGTGGARTGWCLPTTRHGPVMAPPQGRHVLSPDILHQGDLLDRHGLSDGGFEPVVLELLAFPTEADSHDEPAGRHHVEGRRGLLQCDRVLLSGKCHAGTERPSPSGRRRDEGRERSRRRRKSCSIFAAFGERRFAATSGCQYARAEEQRVRSPICSACTAGSTIGVASASASSCHPSPKPRRSRIGVPVAIIPPSAPSRDPSDRERDDIRSSRSGPGRLLAIQTSMNSLPESSS